jgi:ethanolamine ammonia-lyase small subunit
MSDDDKIAPGAALPDVVRRIRARTPARIFVERGASYSTGMQLDLRNARANAVDAVWTEFELQSDFPADFVSRWGLFEVCTEAETKSQFLLRPDLGRRLDASGESVLLERCVKAPDFQIVIGDGLSGAALAAQVPPLFPRLVDRALANAWSVGTTFVVRHCRVGVMNHVGDLLSPRVIVLLIGERPGLATSTSLSAYMAYKPGASQTDADRNLISNIQAHGVGTESAADRIISLAAQMMTNERSGTSLKEDSIRRPKASLNPMDARKNEPELLK